MNFNYYQYNIMLKYRNPLVLMKTGKYKIELYFNIIRYGQNSEII